MLYLENFFNDEKIMLYLNEYKDNEIFSVKNSKKAWIQNKSIKRMQDLRKYVTKTNKNIQCFYQCDTCIYHYSIETIMDSISIYVINKFKQ